MSMAETQNVFSMKCPGPDCNYHYHVALLKVNEVESCPVCGYTAEFNRFVVGNEPIDSGTPLNV